VQRSRTTESHRKKHIQQGRETKIQAYREKYIEAGRRHTHTHIHTDIQRDNWGMWGIYTYILTNIQSHTYTTTHTKIHKGIHTYNTHKHIRRKEPIPTHTHTNSQAIRGNMAYIQDYTHTETHTHTCTHINAYRHTYSET